MCLTIFSICAINFFMYSFSFGIGMFFIEYLLANGRFSNFVFGLLSLFLVIFGGFLASTLFNFFRGVSDDTFGYFLAGF